MRIVFDFGFLCQRKAGRKLRRVMRHWIQQSAQPDKPTPSFRRVAASFNPGLEVLRGDSGEATGVFACGQLAAGERNAIPANQRGTAPCCVSCDFAVCCGVKIRLPCSRIRPPDSAPSPFSRKWLRPTNREDSNGCEPTKPTASFPLRGARLEVLLILAR